jgi:hypothetical protein
MQVNDAHMQYDPCSGPGQCAECIITQTYGRIPTLAASCVNAGICTAGLDVRLHIQIGGNGTVDKGVQSDLEILVLEKVNVGTTAR